MTQQIEIKTVNIADKQKMPVMTIGQGDAVVLIHGFGMDASAWLPFVRPLVHQYRFYLPYMRGFGKASQNHFTQANFVNDYVADIKAMRQQLGLERIRLGGISMGSLTNLALNHANGFEGVSHLLHIDQSPVMKNKADWAWGVMGDSQQGFLASLSDMCALATPYLDKDFKDLPKNVQHSILQNASTMVGASFNTPVIKKLAHLMSKYPRLAGYVRNTKGWQNQLHIVQAYLSEDLDFRSSVPNIHIPTRVVVGEDSRLYPAQGQLAFARLLPNAKVTVMAKAGHALLADRPVASYQVIKAFVQDN